MKGSVSHFFVSVVFSSAVIFVCSVSAYGGDMFTHWQVALGNWSNSDNWDGGEPTGSYTYIENGGTAEITLNGEHPHELHMSNDSTIRMYSGSLSVDDKEYIGKMTVSRFIQSGGTHTVHHNFTLGYGTNGNGIYELSGGELRTMYAWIGFSSGIGEFTHSGGTHTIDGEFILGYSADGTYELSGTGVLDARNVNEYIGKYETGEFTQNGGTNQADHLTITSKGIYRHNDGVVSVKCLSIENGGNDYYKGGSLTIDAGLDVKGTLDLGNSNVAITCNSAIVDLSGGNIVNAGNGSLNVGANSLTIYDAGARPESLFGSYTTQGMMHEKGTTLVVGQTEGFSGAGEIEDFVDCAGTIESATGEGINLENGLLVRSTGQLNLGSGTLTVKADGSSLNGGQLSAATELIGQAATVAFEQTGDSSNNTADEIYLGSRALNGEPAGNGTYTLSGGSITANTAEYVGYFSSGTFNQVGNDTVNTVESLYLGYDLEGDGTYTLSGGRVAANDEYVGFYAKGTFTQQAGTTNNVSGVLYVGYGYAQSDGVYNMNGGSLSADQENVGRNGTGRFTQYSGVNQTNRLTVGDTSNGTGKYELKAGSLIVNDREFIGGNDGVGTMTHTGGTHQVNLAYLGFLNNSTGTYELSGTGEVNANMVYVGYHGTGTFIQEAGTVNIERLMYIGYWADSNGTYRLAGGSFSVGELYVSREGHGVFSIEDSSADVMVTEKLSFGADSEFTAADGSRIHMTGSIFENESTDSGALAGLQNLEMIFEGGDEDVDTFEVAGKDLGNVYPDGWTDNFVLDTLTLGGDDVGKLILTDIFDNNPNWTGQEALYVVNLNIGPGSYLDLNGLNLYYLNSSIDPSATIVYNGGMLIPEPMMVSLVTIGLIGLVFRRKRTDSV